MGYTRLVHDLAKTLNKRLRLETMGGETELDKNVIEELRDPLMHLIRNAADHGVESTAMREASGKDSTGTIRISAEHAGAHVVIKVADDGAGLDREKILSRALERGLVTSTDLDDRSIYALIFEPGFSTAETATNISGRGVGMDVVRRNVEKLRGSIDISTARGKGTAVALTLPLTLAIIDGFMVEVGGHCYIINLSLVRECVEYSKTEEHTEMQGVIRLREKIVPYIDLRAFFDIENDATTAPQIVVAEVDNLTIGLLVDRVVGHCQTVIKPLGKGVRNAEMFSGASILGDGSIALILDSNKIISKAMRTGHIKKEHL